jgi:hypothetical protein
MPEVKRPRLLSLRKLSASRDDRRKPYRRQFLPDFDRRMHSPVVDAGPNDEIRAIDDATGQESQVTRRSSPIPCGSALSWPAPLCIGWWRPVPR